MGSFLGDVASSAANYFFGKNNSAAANPGPTFGTDQGYDPNRSQWGQGVGPSAADTSAGYQDNSNSALGATAAQSGYSGGNYNPGTAPTDFGSSRLGMANAMGGKGLSGDGYATQTPGTGPSYGGFYGAQEQSDYEAQKAANDLMLNEATGQTSAARAYGQTLQNQMQAQQLASAASARSPAGLAMAGQVAAGNIGAQGQQIGAQTQAAAIQEQAQAQAAYAQAIANQRAQTQNRLGQDIGQNQFNAQQQNNMFSQAQNAAQGWAGLANNVNNAQLNASMQQQQQQEGWGLGAGQVASNTGNNNANNEQKGMNKLFSSGSMGMASIGYGGGGDNS